MYSDLFFCCVLPIATHHSIKDQSPSDIRSIPASPTTSTLTSIATSSQNNTNENFPLKFGNVQKWSKYPPITHLKNEMYVVWYIFFTCSHYSYALSCIKSKKDRQKHVNGRYLLMHMNDTWSYSRRVRSKMNVGNGCLMMLLKQWMKFNSQLQHLFNCLAKTIYRLSSGY